MAVEDSPTIIGPTTPSGQQLPAIPSLSPHPSSSSDSYDSSRPNSQASSITSRSPSPSPLSKSSPRTEYQESLELPPLPLHPSPPTNSATQTRPQHDAPTSVPPEAVTDPSRPHGVSWRHRIWSLVPRRNWFTNALGIISLGLTLIGMIIFGERTYKLAVWSAENDTLGTCGQLRQAIPVSSTGSCTANLPECCQHLA